MKASPDNNRTEQHIIETARQAFVENGFAETSMSDIAARAGINRPGLHYYFRTKERLFEAVCGDIIHSFLPTVLDILTQDGPLRDRLARIVDVYAAVFARDPLLPLFMAREVKRDTPHFVEVVRRLDILDKVQGIRDYLQAEMEAGRLRRLPVEHIFYAFYGLLTFPFLARPLAEEVFAAPGRSFGKAYAEWKPTVVRQMELLLAPEPSVPA